MFIEIKDLYEKTYISGKILSLKKNCFMFLNKNSIFILQHGHWKTWFLVRCMFDSSQNSEFTKEKLFSWYAFSFNGGKTLLFFFFLKNLMTKSAENHRFAKDIDLSLQLQTKLNQSNDLIFHSIMNQNLNFRKKYLHLIFNNNSKEKLFEQLLFKIIYWTTKI